MAVKQRRPERVGGRGLALPDCIARAVAANDRVKYYLALLQAAQAQGRSPQHPAPNLRALRESSGITETALDRVVEESVSRGNGITYIPGGCTILDALFDSLRYMAAAIELAGAIRPDVRERSTLYRRRLDALAATMQGCKDDQISNATIAALTKETRNGHDTVHQVTIDMQDELTRLQSTVATDLIEGARTFGVADDDRALIRAFMSGVHETAGLKFTHPGLNTTAAGDGVRLSIQNDLGSMPEHLIVIHVEDRAVTMTYTDVHPSRIRFFQGLVDAYAVTWTSTPASDVTGIVTSAGKYVADSAEDVERFLRFVGSRLVFLIDWNRARKRLTRLVNKSTAIDLLRWAADNNIGHRGFLEAGDVALIETAFERAFPMHTRFGIRLDELLGGGPARQFLTSVFRMTSWGIATGRSHSLIEDQVEAELLRHLETPERHVLAIAAHHATTIIALGERVRRELARCRQRTPPETDAGHAVGQDERRFIDAHHDAHRFKPLLTEAAAAASALEDAAFLLSVMPASIDCSLLTLIEALADQVGATARAYVRCLEEGQTLSRLSNRDVDNFLVTIDQLTASGRDAGGAKRALTEKLLRGEANCREFYALTTIADDLESAASRLSRCGAIVRDQVLRTRLAR
jgi:hypothetical protein